MQHSKPLKLRLRDRYTAVGKTRSGKTTLVEKLLWESWDRGIFFDVKGEESDRFGRRAGLPVLSDIGQVKEALFPEDASEQVRKFVFAGDADRETLDRLCRLCYERKNQPLIIDELLSLYHGTTTPTKWHNKLTVEGAAKGSGIVNCTQRPMGVPKASLSEAEHIFCFYLRQQSDRERMAELLAEVEEDTVKQLDRYHYLYDHESLRETRHHAPLDA